MQATIQLNAFLSLLAQKRQTIDCKGAIFGGWDGYEDEFTRSKPCTKLDLQ